MKHRAAILILALLVLVDGLIWASILYNPSRDNQTQIYFLNVGQGDSQLIELSMVNQEPVQILVDGGPDGGRMLQELHKVMEPTDRYIDLVIATHPQQDHIGGLVDVLRTKDVGAVIDPGRKNDISAYQGFIHQINRKNISRIFLEAGDKIRYGRHVLYVLSPQPQDLLSSEVNDSSIVFLVESPEGRALFTGDIGKNLEKRIADQYDVDAHVLKVSHHGSRFSSEESFIEEVSPKIAIIGVGKNSYGHPAPEVVGRLDTVGARVFDTNGEETIKVLFDNGYVKAYNGL